MMTYIMLKANIMDRQDTNPQFFLPKHKMNPNWINKGELLYYIHITFCNQKYSQMRECHFMECLRVGRDREDHQVQPPASVGIQYHSICA